jgi:hypothetical protein
VPVIGIGIIDIVWDVDAMKDDYTGKAEGSEAGFLIREIEKGTACRGRTSVLGRTGGFRFFHFIHRNSEFDF